MKARPYAGASQARGLTGQSENHWKDSANSDGLFDYAIVQLLKENRCSKIMHGMLTRAMLRTQGAVA